MFSLEIGGGKSVDFDYEPGKYYGTPRQFWGFQIPVKKSDTNSKKFKFVFKLFADFIKLKTNSNNKIKQRAVLKSLAATHIIYQQEYKGIRVHRGFITVHIGNKNNAAYLLKNQAVPISLLEAAPGFGISAKKAEQIAIQEFEGETDLAKLQVVGKTTKRYVPMKGEIRPCYRVRLLHIDPTEDWICYIDSQTKVGLMYFNNLSNARARVFDPSPTMFVDSELELIEDDEQLLPPEECYAEVELKDLSKSGYLDGKRVTTKLTPKRAKRKNGDFIFESTELGLGEVMAYHHINEAVRYLESLGYSGKHAIFREPVKVNTQATDEDNSWYYPSGKSIGFGTGRVNDAEDGETILHELGHAIQDAICPDFGQNSQASAIGEGFADYFAASYFGDKKSERYQNSVITWDGIFEEHFDPRSIRRLDSEKTFANFLEEGGQHENGPIWSATLWEIRKELGREKADKLIIESQFEQDGFTSFSRAARAILHADINLFGGKHKKKLRQIFARRLIRM